MEYKDGVSKHMRMKSSFCYLPGKKYLDADHYRFLNYQT